MCPHRLQKHWKKKCKDERKEIQPMLLLSGDQPATDQTAADKACRGHTERDESIVHLQLMTV